MKRDFRARWYDKMAIWFSKWNWGFIAKDVFLSVMVWVLGLACIYMILAIAG